MLSPEMTQALHVAVLQWYASVKRCVEASAALADAQAQLAHAERDLCELGRALEGQEGLGAARISEIVNGQAPVSTVTMPVVSAGPMVAPDTDGSPAQIVLEYLKQQREIGAP